LVNFVSMAVDTFYIHPSSIVDKGVVIGAGTKVWHFCHLMPDSTIGNNCILGQNIYIDKNVSIGNRVKIQNNVSVYNGVTIEDDVFLGPSVVFTNVINPRSFIERKDEFKATLIKKGATIGANATILCGIEIGSYAMVGAGTVVAKNVPSYALVVGNPSRQIGWVSENGNRLEFNETGIAICEATGKKYKLQHDSINPLD
jgi:UDP-2-acetamido-3-amino-2,3-dideoxy-glucuronate N-acetyltransferase